MKVDGDTYERLRQRIEDRLNQPDLTGRRFTAFDLSEVLTHTFLVFLDELGSIAAEGGMGGILIPAPPKTERLEANDRDD